MFLNRIENRIRVRVDTVVQQNYAILLVAYLLPVEMSTPSLLTLSLHPQPGEARHGTPGAATTSASGVPSSGWKNATEERRFPPPDLLAASGVALEATAGAGLGFLGH